ncbi:MAG: hypothetical protein HKN16_05700, partial [Saprospiraceae bacterium]|nr:hypothetical protein [Saprospiraceae bacterium]
FLAGWLGKGEGEMKPWCYLYAVLIYLICIPGVFAITLNVYLFLFERQPIFRTDVYTQILPVLSMIATLLIINRNVDIRRVPGFGRLSGLVLMLTALISVMWLLEKMHIFAITFIPFSSFMIIVGVIVIGAIWGWTRFVRPSP